MTSRPRLRKTAFQALAALTLSIAFLARAGADATNCPPLLKQTHANHVSSIEKDWAQTESKDEFFDYWSEKDPRALAKWMRSNFDSLMQLKRDSKLRYSLKNSNGVDANHGETIAEIVHQLASEGKSFEETLKTFSQSAVEIVLTAHPTQIQSTEYRLLWQLKENLERIQNRSHDVPPNRQLIEAINRQNRRILRRLGIRSSPNLSEVIKRIENTFPGPIRKLTASEEVNDMVSAYFGNLYEAHRVIRKQFIDAMVQAYGNDSHFDLRRVQNAASRLQRLSTWSWDADGKNNITADAMVEASAIQQEAIYRLHHDQLQWLIENGRVPNTRAIRLFLSVLKQHAQNVLKDPFSIEIINQFVDQADLRIFRASESPSEHVRSFLATWADKLRFSENSAEMGALAEDIRSFVVQNHIRQNSATLRAAVEALFADAGLRYDLEAIRRIANDRQSVRHLREIARTSQNPVLKVEFERFSVFAKDPGTDGAIISADTRSLEDIEQALFLMEIAEVTGKVRYFPLIENMDTFREIEQIVTEGLNSHSLWRRQIEERAKTKHEPPTLNIMFALSDTSRLGSQAAPHLMELKSQAIRKTAAPIAVAEFWGGGSQLARGGDWISDSKPIFTDQGNARDLKYDSVFSALDRMNRHLGESIRKNIEPLHTEVSPADSDIALLERLITTREKLYQDLFFSANGYRNAIEAYLFLGSMLAETKSNSYGARPVNRVDDSMKVVATPNRIADRLYENSEGKSFDEVLSDLGLAKMLETRLTALFQMLRPGVPYSPPSIDQRAITIDNAFSETKFNQLAEAVSAEVESGIDLAASARFLSRNEAPFQSYRRQKMAEVIATPFFNEESHLMRLPKRLRALVSDSKMIEHFKTKTRGRSVSELTVRDWLATIAYVHQTVHDVEIRNRELETQLARTLSASENPIARAHHFVRSQSLTQQRPFVRLGESLLGWMHRRSTFGDGKRAPSGLSNLFSALSTDEIARLEYLAWALHYEGQQLSIELNELTR